MGVSNFDSLDTTGTITQETAVNGNIKCTTLTVTGASAFTGNVSSSGYYLSSVGAALTAAGTDRATALQLAAEINNIATAAASTGVVLPVGVIGMRILVINNGANAIQVYASGSETINGTAGATGVSLASGGDAFYIFTAANTWISVAIN